MKEFNNKKLYTREDYKKIYYDTVLYKKIQKMETIEALATSESLPLALLDSSLISRTNILSYTHKIVQCGSYYQVYEYSQPKSKKNQNMIKENDIDIDYLFKKGNLKTKDFLRIIEYKNIMRSKFQLQRLAKSNEHIFKTFITLTFTDNITDINIAHKYFNNWCHQVKRYYPNFAYLGVPEFQKRGAVHYHILTNLSVDDNKVIIPQPDKKGCYDVKYWVYGKITSVFKLNNINVVAYLTKYFTKDIDDRLWGRRRYLASRNLIQPSTIYINTNKLSDFALYVNYTSDYSVSFSSTYYDKLGNAIDFKEYKKNDL